MLFYYISLICIHFVTSTQMNGNTLRDEIISYFNEKLINEVTFLGCSNSDFFIWSKMLSQNGIRSSSFPILFDFNSVLKSKYTKLGVVWDVECDSLSDNLIKEANSHTEWFNNLHHWFIYPATNDSRILKLFRFDSQVRMPIFNEDESQLEFQEIFQLNSKIYYNEPDRDNFRNTTLNVGIVIFREKWDKTGGTRSRKLTYNSVNEVGIDLCYLLGELYNFQINEYIYTNFGYKPTNGYLDGAVGDLQNHTLDVTPGTILMKWRWNYLYFTSPVIKFCPRFIFRRPPISATKNIYFLAFDYDIWLLIILMIILGGIVLTVTERLGNQNEPFQGHDRWFDYSYVSLIILLLQGSDTSPLKNSSRVVFLFLLILAVLFDTCYSASIVVLLQSPNYYIKTLKDLFYSPFKMVLQDNEYNNGIINFTTDPLIKRLYNERIFSRPSKESFIGIPEGLRKVRSGEYAFHTNVEAYQQIAETFTESEKCGLQELYMFPCELIYMSLVRESEYTHYFKKGLVLLNEIGLRKRAIKIWYPESAKCSDQFQEFISISFQDIKPAVIFMSCGVLLTIVIFILEIIYDPMKLKCKKK